MLCPKGIKPWNACGRKREVDKAWIVWRKPVNCSENRMQLRRRERGSRSVRQGR